MRIEMRNRITLELFVVVHSFLPFFPAYSVALIFYFFLMVAKDENN